MTKDRKSQVKGAEANDRETASVVLVTERPDLMAKKWRAVRLLRSLDEITKYGSWRFLMIDLSSGSVNTKQLEELMHFHQPHGNIIFLLWSQGSLRKCKNIVMNGNVALLDLKEVNNAIERLTDKNADKKFESATFCATENAFHIVFQNKKAYTVSRSLFLGEDMDDGTTVVDSKIAANGYHFEVLLGSGKRYEVPWDLVLHYSEPSYEYYNGKIVERGHAKAGIYGQRVRRLRKAKGFTLERLAELTGMKHSNIARIESGKHKPSLDTLERIANALNVAVALIVAE